MKNLKALLIVPIVLLLVINSCKKDDLPKATTTGENTMAAKVNGKLWQKKACWSCTGGGTGLIINYDDRDFFAVTGEDHDLGFEIALAITSLKKTGTYNLTSRNLDFARMFEDNGAKYYYTSVKNTGHVTVTKLDLTNQIISGTFDFTAEDENDPNKTISVTEGRFDVRYH